MYSKVKYCNESCVNSCVHCNKNKIKLKKIQIGPISTNKYKIGNIRQQNSSIFGEHEQCGQNLQANFERRVWSECRLVRFTREDHAYAASCLQAYGASCLLNKEGKTTVL